MLMEPRISQVCLTPQQSVITSSLLSGLLSDAHTQAGQSVLFHFVAVLL